LHFVKVIIQSERNIVEEINKQIVTTFYPYIDTFRIDALVQMIMVDASRLHHTLLFRKLESRPQEPAAVELDVDHVECLNVICGNA
jgi:hypothetical protein